MCLSFIAEMDSLVKLEMRQSWIAKKPSIFVQNEADPYDLRFPGKWKQEFTTRNGGIIM